MDALLHDASRIYAGAYFGVIVVIALLEWVIPRRTPGETLVVRWSSNGAITILDGLVVRAVLPVAGIAWAELCRQRGWGLFNQTAWPSLIEVAATIVALDLLFYAQHYLLHRVPWLWRLHRTHHSDQEYDFSTGVRFHPLEALFTTTLQLGAILALGASPAGTFLSQLIAAVASFVEHGNVRIPQPVDRMMRTLFVTPDMHRIHHSIAPGESRSNFSNTFSWWDRLFGTYMEQPAAGHEDIQFGLLEFSERKHATLPWMLAQPFLAGDRNRSRAAATSPAPAPPDRDTSTSTHPAPRAAVR